MKQIKQHYFILIINTNDILRVLIEINKDPFMLIKIGA